MYKLKCNVSMIQLWNLGSMLLHITNANEMVKKIGFVKTKFHLNEILDDIACHLNWIWMNSNSVQYEAWSNLCTSQMMVIPRVLGPHDLESYELFVIENCGYNNDLLNG